MDANLKEIVGEALKENLPEVVDAVVDAKLEEVEANTEAKFADVNESIKALQKQAKTVAVTDELSKKTAIVYIFRDVLQNKVTGEKAFNEVVEKHVKAMTEGTATDGAELVFDQFEANVLQVINTFELVSNVNIMPLAKGDKVSIPKATNGISTMYVAEGGTPTESEIVTAFVTFDIYKMVTLTDFTEELLDDAMTIPDLYNLIVSNIGESQGAFLEKQILAGTGSSALEGILVNSAVNSISLAATKRAGDINHTNLIEVITKAMRKYKRGGRAKFVMSQYVLGKLQSIKTTDGYPLFPELMGATPTLMGAGIILTDDSSLVQDLASDIATKPLLIYGDLSYYTLVRRKGLTVERGYYGNNWRDGVISLKSNARFGGKCTFGEAFVKLLNGAT